MADPAGALGVDERELDEYALAASSGAPSGGRRGLVAIGALLLGLLMAVSVGSGRRDARAEDERMGELVALVREQKEDVDALSASLEELTADVARRQGEIAAVVPALDAALAVAERQAGLTSLAGPGVVVRLFDAPPGCTGAPFLCRVQDFDLQQTVNALFSARAEAVAVGDQRIVATTALRAAGGQITANYRFLDSPYEIRAIGDPDALRAALDRQDLAGAFEGAGSDLRIEVQTADEVVVPGLTAPPDVRVAEPAAAGAAASPPAPGQPDDEEGDA